MDYKSIPIFIISFNRLFDLKNLIERLEKDNYKNIIVLDNASTDEALLVYIKKLKHKVCFFKKNYGHMVLWKCGIFNDILDKTYYVVTDPDILPVEDCPDNYVEYFYYILQLYPQKRKVGFSLKIDDLPESYIYKYDTIRWESFFYEKKISKGPLLYDAIIDTTFALYRPGETQSFYTAIRTAYPYTARHLGWYVDVDQLDKETEKYFMVANESFSSFDQDRINSARMTTIQKILRKIVGEEDSLERYEYLLNKLYEEIKHDRESYLGKK